MLKVTQSTSSKNAVRNAIFCSPQSKVASFQFALIDGKWIKKIEPSSECTDFSLLYVNNCDRKNMNLVLSQSVTVEKIELEYLHREDKITVLPCDPKISIVEHLEQILQSVKGTVVEPDMEYMPIHKIRVKFLVTVFTYINEDCILSMEERSSGGTISNMSKIDFTTIKIGGLGAQLKELTKRVFATRLMNPSLLKKMAIKHIKGVLLYGPPGNGKTALARRLGEITGITKIKIVNGPELLNKYVGESEKNIRDCFDEARKNPDEIHMLIFDEFDSLAVSRGGSNDNNNKIVGQLLTMMDGVEEQSNIIVFALTNRLDILDPAILRPGRFGLHIMIPQPNEQSRFEILKIHCNGILSDPELRLISEMTKDFSGADLEYLIQKTIQDVIGEFIDFNDIKNSIRKMNSIEPKYQDFVSTLKLMKPSPDIYSSLVSVESDPFLVEKICQNSGKWVTAICGERKSGKTSLLGSVAKRFAAMGMNPTLISPRSVANFSSDKEKVKYILDTFDGKNPILIDDIHIITEKVNFSYNAHILSALRTGIVSSSVPVVITSPKTILPQLEIFEMCDDCLELVRKV